MSTNRYLGTDLFGISTRGTDIPRHLREHEAVKAPHILASSPTGIPIAAPWPVRVFTAAGGDQDGLTRSGFIVIDEIPSHLVLGEHGRAVEKILYRPRRADDLRTDRRVHDACLEIADWLRGQGLATAVAIIQRTCHGWTRWALDALAAAESGTGELDAAAPTGPAAHLEAA